MKTSLDGGSARRLVLLVLAVLREGPLHGYAVVRKIEENSGGLFSPGEGLLYPLLHGLEQSECLVSRWEEVSGRKRKVYALTSAGERRLANERERWEAETRAVMEVVGPKEEVRLALG